MEFIEGQTLREKINSLGFKQAVEAGIQIAEGLAAAHEHGIVHRDIKPDNIMVRKDGRLLIMDFGLAKIKGTVTRITKEGSTVGTAGYMSPEQIQGLETDHRSDIFSLGVVFYEMFTRQLPFKGLHETALAYEIVNVDPEPLSAVNPDIDSGLDAIVLDCIEKDPVERCQSAAEVARNLRRFKRSSAKHRASGFVAGDMSASDRQLKTATKKILQLPYVGMSVAALLLLGLIASLFLRGPSVPEGQMIQAYIHPEPGTRLHYIGPNPGPVAVSPDGSRITYTGTNAEGNHVLWVRPLNTLQSHQLRGTEGASAPFWSPDSRYIGFFADGKLKTVPAAGGIPETLADDVWVGSGGTWNEDGIILYSAGPLNPITKIPASGGEPVDITGTDKTRGEYGHRWPHFLPNGEHFLYLVSGEKPEDDGVYVGSLKSDKKLFLFRNLSKAVYASGHILFVRENRLFAQPFNIKRLELTGEPFPIVDYVLEMPPMARGGFSVSQNGILAYHSDEGNVAGGTLPLYDRNGNLIQTIGEPNPYGFVRFSPDGRKVTVHVLDPRRRTNDIWWFDIGRNAGTRLTYEEPFHRYPIWSPDGNYIAFQEAIDNQYLLKIKSLFGENDERIVFQSERNFRPTSWSPDGKYVGGYKVKDQETPSDLWVIPLDENEDPFPVFQSRFNDEYIEFSPDGNWIAYESDETGRFEVYVRPFPEPGRKWQITTVGGSRPVWTKNGRELIYMDRNRNLTAVEIRLHDGNVDIGELNKLFTPVSILHPRGFDVTSDGETFIVSDVVTGGEHDVITLVVNWDVALPK